MSRLKETTVQTHALRWLVEDYDSRPQTVAVSRPEAWVCRKSPMGRGRADGVIAAQLNDGSVHVASVEAKSWKTRASVLLTPRNGFWLLHGVLAGVLAALVAMGLGWSTEHWVWMWLVPALVLIAVSLAYLWTADWLGRYYGIELLDQIKRYPGNDRWIALPNGVWGKLSRDEQDKLRHRCEAQRTGLLLVGRTGTVQALEHPTTEPTPKGVPDYLVCYSAGETIRKDLAAKITARQNASTEDETPDVAGLPR